MNNEEVIVVEEEVVERKGSGSLTADELDIWEQVRAKRIRLANKLMDEFEREPELDESGKPKTKRPSARAVLDAFDGLEDNVVKIVQLRQKDKENDNNEAANLATIEILKNFHNASEAIEAYPDRPNPEAGVTFTTTGVEVHKDNLVEGVDNETYADFKLYMEKKKSGEKAE